MRLAALPLYHSITRGPDLHRRTGVCRRLGQPRRGQRDEQGDDKGGGGDCAVDCLAAGGQYGRGRSARCCCVGQPPLRHCAILCAASSVGLYWCGPDRWRYRGASRAVSIAHGCGRCSCRRHSRRRQCDGFASALPESAARRLQALLDQGIVDTAELQRSIDRAEKLKLPEELVAPAQERLRSLELEASEASKRRSDAVEADQNRSAAATEAASQSGR